MNETTRHVVGSLGADIGPSQSPSLHEQADVLGPRYYAYERIDISALGLPAMRGSASCSRRSPGSSRGASRWSVRPFAAMASDVPTPTVGEQLRGPVRRSSRVNRNAEEERP
jgi:hypothetical protein